MIGEYQTGQKVRLTTSKRMNGLVVDRMKTQSGFLYLVHWKVGPTVAGQHPARTWEAARDLEIYRDSAI